MVIRKQAQQLLVRHGRQDLTRLGCRGIVNAVVDVARGEGVAPGQSLLRRFPPASSVGAGPVTCVLIVSDIRLYREGLAEFLRRDGRLTVEVAAGAEHAVAFAERPDVDVALVDRSMAASSILIECLASSTRVLTLASPAEDDDVIDAAEAGVSGYVTRESSLEDLLDAIERAARGEAICPAPMAASLLRRVAALSGERPGAEQPSVRLTARETEIMALIDGGLSNKEIAARLHIAPPTVKNHVHNILEKLGVSRRFEAAAAFRAEAPKPVTRRSGN